MGHDGLLYEKCFIFKFCFPNLYLLCSVSFCLFVCLLLFFRGEEERVLATEYNVAVHLGRLPIIMCELDHWRCLIFLYTLYFTIDTVQLILLFLLVIHISFSILI